MEKTHIQYSSVLRSLGGHYLSLKPRAMNSVGRPIRYIPFLAKGRKPEEGSFAGCRSPGFGNSGFGLMPRA